MANPFAALGKINATSQPKPVNGFAIGQQIGGQIKQARTNSALANVLDPNNQDPQAAFAALADVDASVANQISQQRLKQSNFQQQQSRLSGQFDQTQDLAERKFGFTQSEAARKSAIPAKRDIRQDAGGFQRFSDTGERVFPDATKTTTPKITTIFDSTTGLEQKGFFKQDGSFQKVGGQKAPSSGMKVTTDKDGNTTVSFGGSKAKKFTEFQSKAANFANRGINAEANLAKAVDQGFNPALSIVEQEIRNSLPEGARSQEHKLYEIGKQDWIASALRLESGAAIAPSEYERFDKAFFPQSGDGKDIISTKKKSRENLMNGLRQSSGGAFDSFGFGGEEALNKAKKEPSSSDTSGSLFPSSLVTTESGGNFKAQNNEVGAGGKKGHFGRVQFGKARLQEAKNAGAIPRNMTVNEFLNDPEAQIKAENWHFTDIGKFIDKNNLERFVGQEINGVPVTRNGMIAMAHLGGKNGMRRHLLTKGKYNPSDSFGTSLTDYSRTHGGEQTQGRVTHDAGGENFDPNLPPLPTPPSNIGQVTPEGNVINRPTGELSQGQSPLESAGEAVLDTAGQAVQQIPFNDEIAGAIGGVIDTIVGGGDVNIVDAIDRSIDQQRELEQVQQLRSPTASQVGQVVGDTAVGLAETLASGGANVLVQPIAKTIGLGVAGGGLAGGLEAAAAAQGGVGDRLASSALPTAAGSAIGGAIPSAIGAARGVGGVVKSLVGAKGTAEQQALQKVSAATLADEVPIEQARQTIDESAELGVPTGVIDTFGSTVERLGRGVKTVGGKGADRAVQVLSARNATQPDRVVNATSKMFGNPDDFVSTLSAIRTSRRNLAEPMYEAAYDIDIVPSPKLEELVQRPAFIKAAQQAKILAAEEGNSLVKEVDGQKIITTQGWDYFKKALGDLSGISKAGGVRDNNISRAIDSTRRELTNELKRLNPKYAEALEMYSGSRSMQDALEAGEGVFKKSSREVSDHIASLTASEKEMYRLGAANAIRFRMGENTNQSRNFASQVFTDDNFKRLREAFPNAQSFAKFKRMVTLEAERHARGQRILGGSQTADKQQDVADLGRGLSDIMFGGAKNAVVNGAKGALSKMFSKVDDKVSDEISKILFEMNPREVTKTLGRLQSLQMDGKVNSQNLSQVFSQILSVQSGQQTGNINTEGF